MSIKQKLEDLDFGAIVRIVFMMFFFVVLGLSMYFDLIRLWCLTAFVLVGSIGLLTLILYIIVALIRGMVRMIASWKK